MILQALNQYYERKAADPETGIAPEGFEHKEIPFVIVIDPDGNLVNIEDTRQTINKKLRAKSFLVPQGEKRSSGVKPYLLWDNMEYVLGVVGKGKADRVILQHQAFIERIKNLNLSDDPGVNAVLKFMGKEPENALATSSYAEEIRGSCPFMSFRLNTDVDLVCQRKAVIARIKNENSDGAGSTDNGNYYASSNNSDTSGNSSKDSGFESQSSEPRYAHYQVDEQEKKPEEKKKGRHHRLHNDKAASSGFGRKAGNTITLAVIFGLVAGLVFQAVNMVSDKYFKKETQTAVGSAETLTSSASASTTAEESTDAGEGINAEITMVRGNPGITSMILVIRENKSSQIPPIYVPKTPKMNDIAVAIKPTAKPIIREPRTE